MGSLEDQERLVEHYLAQNNKEAAVKLLFELIVVCAKDRNFVKAEALRNRIIEIDPMALEEIIRSGEIIEREKDESIDKGHREIWSKLYGLLNAEEATTFYFALENKSYDPDEIVYRQGGKDAGLYFVNQGNLKIAFNRGGGEVLLKSITAGRIAGEETFFIGSMCTTSMIAQSRVDLSRLDAAAPGGWEKACPLLTSKLVEFISGFEKTADLIKAKGLDRRAHKRIPFSGDIVVQVFAQSGKPVGRPFTGDICDLSPGGLCFAVRINKRETANLLLGQRLGMSFTHPGADSPTEVNMQGTIVAVRFHPLVESSLHVKFDSVLTA
ncbi:MAG: cyclic nucleotide-binding domain-containing protein [Syntrophobacteraceae bacterium]